MPYCTECGYQIAEGDAFCGRCGHKLENPLVFSREYEKSYNNSRIKRLSNREKRLILFNHKSNHELVNMARQNGISLTKQGFFRKRKVKNKKKIIEILARYDFDVDELLIEVTRGFDEFPVKDTRGETEKKYRLFLNDTRPYEEEFKGHYSVGGDFIIPYKNKLDTYLEQTNFFHTVKDTDPYIFFPRMNASYLQTVLDSSEKIMVSDTVFSTGTLIRCLLALGNIETRIYSVDDRIYLINDLGEALSVTPIDKKRSTGLTLEKVVKRYTPERYLEAHNTLWEELLTKIIWLLDEINLFDELHSLETEKTKGSLFPRDNYVLIAAWKREIKDWQPAYIEYTLKEQEAWDQLRKLNNLEDDLSGLLGALLVNLFYARCEREMNLETLKAQLWEMEAYEKEGSLRHVDAVNQHLERQLQWIKTRKRLRNDYIDILLGLVEAGLPLPGRLVPEKFEINEEDYQLGQYIVERELTPLQRRIIERGYDPHYIPLLTEYEEYRAGLKSRDEQDAIMDGLDETSRWYFDMMRKMK